MEEEIEVQKFVSSRTISLERNQLRDDRDTVLRNAERKYNSRVEKEEQKVARGDHKWMLPDLDNKLDSKKKKKKHKKEKKKKDKKKDSDSEDDWVESDNNKVDQSKLERDSFMEFGFLATYSKADLKAKAKVDQKPEIDHKKALGDSRELNSQLRAQSGAAPLAKPAHGGQSGDGGLTWLIRAFKRAEDQAKDGGQSLEEIAEKRWGSVETFLEMVSKAKAKASYIDRKLEEELSRLERDYQFSMSAEPSRQSKPSQDNRDRRPRSKDRDNRDRPSFREVRSRSRSKDKKKRSRSRDARDRKHRSRSKSRSAGRRDMKQRSGSRDRRDKSRSRSGGRERRQRPRSRDNVTKFARPGEKISKSLGYSSREGGGSWKSAGRREVEQEEGRKKAAESEKLHKQASDSSSGSEKEEEIEKDKKEPPPASAVLTEAEMNTLASKVLKAELMGNDELAVELKQKLENARTTRAEMVAKGINPDQEGPEVVTKIRGENMKQRRKKTKVETHKDGERVRYFGDDDKYNLQQMFEREKMDTAEDHHEMMSRLGSKAEKTNDDFDMDDMIISKAAGKQSEELEDIKRKNKAVANQMAMEKTLQDCKWCIGSKRSQKHLMVSMGKSVYLALPGTTSMAQGHCLIVPMGHCMAGTEMDEDVWNEVQDYRKSLVRMFQSQGEDCVFFETAIGFKRHPHMVIECIPLPEDMGSMLPMYYQKAIQECETEWSDNKKLVKLKEKNIARNIPRGLPYFHVDFGLDMGFAHVIEDEADWNKRFGHEVVGGMMDTEPRTMRNPAWEQFDEQKRKVIQFGGMWSEFDWTKSLKASRKTRDSSASDSD